MKLIIQIPCFNEEENLDITFNDLPKKIKGIDKIEYLIIDDGSTDKTVEVAKKLGFNHIVSLKENKGLAKGFIAGLDTCLKLGADIIVNTDADNQYFGEDIEKLVRPILDQKADIVIGERDIQDTEHFSKNKKFFQKFGSLVVRIASESNIPDAPSGFRAYSKEAAMKINVTNNYTYTLETIIQAGRSKIAMTSVKIRTNREIRPSRLFSNIWQYMRKSSIVIIRSFMMYKPLKFFSIIALILLICGLAIAFRFLIFYFSGAGTGNIQSLILAALLIGMSFNSYLIGLLSDLIAVNRNILEDIRYRVRNLEINDAQEKDKKV